MNYLTNYYKNLSEQLQEKVNHLEVLLEYYKEDERFQQSVMDLGMPTKADRDRMADRIYGAGIDIRYSKDGSAAVYSTPGDIYDPAIVDKYDPSPVPHFYTDFSNRMEMETGAMDPNSERTSLWDLQASGFTQDRPQSVFSIPVYPENLRWWRARVKHDRQEDRIASQIERERDARFPELAKEKREIVDREKSIERHNDLVSNLVGTLNNWSNETRVNFPTASSLLYRLGVLADQNLTQPLLSLKDKNKLEGNPTVSNTHFKYIQRYSWPTTPNKLDWNDYHAAIQKAKDDVKDQNEITRGRQISARDRELFGLPKQEQKSRHWSQSYHP